MILLTGANGFVGRQVVRSLALQKTQLRIVLQYPQDMVAMQELIWQIKPDLIIETGIRAHNRAAIEAHPMANRIQLIQGSSIDPEIITRVHAMTDGHQRILVCLDANHTHDHVLAELEAYAPLDLSQKRPGSDCVVFDTIIEDMPADMFPNRRLIRSSGPGDNPKTAVHQYLKTHPEFEIDKQIDHKLLISVAPDGYLRRLKNHH